MLFHLNLMAMQTNNRSEGSTTSTPVGVPYEVIP